MIDVSWFLWAEHFSCFPEVQKVASGCVKHQENLIHGNNGRDHDIQLCVLLCFCLNISKSRWVTNCLSDYEAVEFNASLHYTSCYLAQDAGGEEMQFQVTLHGVPVSNTHPQIFARYVINRDTKRLDLLPAKKKPKTQKEISSWVWMERAHVNNSWFRWALGLRRISYMVLTILLQHYTVLFVSLRSTLSHQNSDLEVLIFFPD